MTKSMMNLVISIAILLSILTLSYTSFSQTSFIDVSSSHWAYNYIMSVVDKGFFRGYPDGTFRPNNQITKAEIATVIVNVMKVDTSIPVKETIYVDVFPNDWFYTNVEYSKKYLDPYVNTVGNYNFYPRENVIREDIISAVVRMKGFDYNNTDVNALQVFKDFKLISVKNLRYMAVALEEKLIKGYDDDTIRPQNSLTRAEASVLLESFN